MVRGEGARLLAGKADHADRDVVVHERGEQQAAKTTRSSEVPVRGWVILRLGVDDLRRLAAANQRQRRKFRDRPREQSLQGFIRFGSRRRERGQMNCAADKAKHRRRVAADQPVGARRDGVEHRLHVRRRLGDDLQNVCRRRLALQRLLRLVEQPRVLHRDLRLPGEALRDGDLTVRERPYFLAHQVDDPDDRAGFAQRHAEVAPNPAKFDAGDGHGNPAAISFRRREILDLENGAISGGAIEQQR